jgi:hypothetical protein
MVLQAAERSEAKLPARGGVRSTPKNIDFLINKNRMNLFYRINLFGNFII